jgi:Arc/MetJ-type ribon-helix-helix transcriptional regulator
MTIHLPQDLENSIRFMVASGRYRSEDELVAQAVRSFLRQKQDELPISKSAAAGAINDDLGPDPLLGSMRDAANDLDEIVADAMKRRREEAWREINLG